jgi:hypothetical protein
VQFRVTAALTRAVRQRLDRRLACVSVADGRPCIPVTLDACDTRLYRRDDRVVGFSEADTIERHDFRIRRRAAGWACRTLAAPESAEAALRWITAVELLHRQGLILHGSSIVRDGWAYVFLGPSGAGKTTIATEAEADAVLSDELSIVAKRGAEWLAWPSPFWGWERWGQRYEAAPIAALFMLDGWAETVSEPTPPPQAALALYRRAIDVGADERTPGLALAAIAELVESVPVHRLTWRRGDDLSSTLDLPCVPLAAD